MPAINTGIFVVFGMLLSLQEVLTMPPIPEKECKSWKRISGILENTFTGNFVNCTRNSLCTGVSCTGSFMTSPFTAAGELFPCSQPVKLYLSAHSEGLHVFNESKNFTDGESVAIPGLTLDLPVVGNVEGWVEVHLKKEQNFVLITVIGKAHLTSTGGVKVDPFPKKLQFDVLRNYKLEVPDCPLPSIPTPSTVMPTSENPYASGRKCVVGQLGQCSRNETCTQLSLGSYKGSCKCLPGYHRNKVGKCVLLSGVTTSAPSTPPLVSTSAVTTTGQPEANSTSSFKSFSSKKTIITAAVGAIGVCMLLGVVVAVFIVIRRRRQNSTAYTLVANFSDGEDDSQLLGQNEELA